MGLKYSSADSSNLIQALTSNLRSGAEAVNQLKSGSQKVVAAIDGKTLSGAAYTAGKGLFSELIIPTITRVTTAIDSIEQDLQKYQSADQVISSEGYLDEDNLNQQIAIKKSMKLSVDAAAVIAKTLSRNNPVAKVLDSLFEFQRNLGRMSNDLQEGIRDLEKKLQKLQQFSAETSGLFGDSLSDMKIAMQGVMVLNATIVNSDGSYTLPDGVEKNWFTSLQDAGKVGEMEDKAKNTAIKELNDLFSKSPAAAIEKIKNNDRLFGYVIAALDKFPKGLQDAALGIFIAQESWNQLPKNIAKSILNNPKFGLYVGKMSLDNQAKVYGNLLHLSDKGWDVLAPLGYVTSVLSKSKAGAKVIAGSKVGLTLFKKFKPISKFIKEHPGTREGLAYGGDALTITAYAYEEYTNPKSPAYGNESMALYGGINKFLVNSGPLEGAQYGGPVGALAGTLNYFGQGGGLSDVPGVNKIPYIKDALNWIDEKHTFISEKDKEKWIKEQYEIYGKRHEGLQSGDYSGFEIPNSEYKPGIPSHSGSPNSNPSINNENIFPNGVN